MPPINSTLERARAALHTISETIETLTLYRDDTALQIAEYLRMSNSGFELDPEMIKATLIKPYTLIPINQNEAWLIQWAGIKTPVLGYVVGKDGPFIKSRVSRSMDLITPFPQYIKEEMQWAPPAHKVTIDGQFTSVQLIEGDEATFKRKYGVYLGKKTGADTHTIKGGNAWINLVSALIADGILPYTPKPISAQHWDNEAKLAPRLQEVLDKLHWLTDRPYILRALAEWRNTGAMLFNIPPSGGKSLIFYLILTHFKGRVLLFADTKPLTQKWQRDLKLFAPNADVTVSTYQGAAKYKDSEWDLVLFDEAHRLPADTFSKLAFFKTQYRAGATATAWREDKRQHLIVALCGKPFYIPWEELISAGVLKKPRIYVAIVKNDSAKLAFVKSLINKRPGKSLIFCDWITMGNEYAKALDVPFVHGETKNQLDVIESSEVVIASKVADRGLSMQNLRLVIEVAFQGRSREQFGQRVGRLLHSDFFGAFYTVFTPEELQAYQSRIYGVELELAGEVDIEYLYIDTVKESTPRESMPRRISPQHKPAQAQAAKIAKPVDDIGRILATPSVAAKIKAAELPGWKVKALYLAKLIRYLWDMELSPQEIAEAKGQRGKNAIPTLRASCDSLAAQGLLLTRDGVYWANKDYINRLVALSEKIGK